MNASFFCLIGYLRSVITEYKKRVTEDLVYILVEQQCCQKLRKQSVWQYDF